MVLAKTSPIGTPNSTTSVVELGFSTRAVRALLDAGLDTYGKISSIKFEELLEIPKLGQVTATEITRKIANLNLEVHKEKTDNISSVEEDNNLDLLVLALNRRALQSLTNAGISTLGELVSLDKKTLLQIKGIGENTYKHIQKAIKVYYLQKDQGDLVLSNLGLDNRTLNALRRNKLFYVSQLEHMSIEELSNLRGIGSSSLENLLRRYSLVTGKKISSCKEMYQVGGIDEYKTPIESLDFTNRAYNALKKSGFRYVEEIANLKESDLLNIANIGAKSLESIQYELNRYYSSPNSELIEFQTLDEYIHLIQETLSSRQKDILNRRLAIFALSPETLEAIAEDYNISRERVRQIEKKARKKLFAASNIKAAESLFVVFRKTLEDAGGIANISLIKSQILKKHKATNVNPSSVIPLFLSLSGCKELSDGLWALNKIDKEQVDLIAYEAESIIIKSGPLSLDVLAKMIVATYNKDEDLIRSSISNSKKLALLPDQTVELTRKSLLIKKRRVDYAKAVIKKLNRPAHYREITELINEMLPDKAHYSPKSIQVALGSSMDFVRVKVGTYALKEEFID